MREKRTSSPLSTAGAQRFSSSLSGYYSHQLLMRPELATTLNTEGSMCAQGGCQGSRHLVENLPKGK